MSFWTDIIAYSPQWVDVYPERVRRFVAAVSEGAFPGAVLRAGSAEITCYGILDLDEEARKNAKNPNMKELKARLLEQVRSAEKLDCDATGEYDPPSWTESSDTHMGPYIHAEGAPARLHRILANAPKIPFAELELLGMRADKQIADTLSIRDGDGFMEISEINLEVGPNFSIWMEDEPEFAGWLRIAFSGEGQPHPLTPEQMIERAQNSEDVNRILRYAADCFKVPEWHWAISCTG